MRVAWFTPYSTRSAIGEFSQHVTAALATLADVELWTPTALDPRPSEVPVIQFGGAGAEAAREPGGYDHVIYNIGNYWPFHADIHAVMERHPGTVILHDRVLHHLFAEIWRREPQGLGTGYVKRMQTYHGEAGARVASEFLAGARAPVWESDAEVARYPLDAAALQGALGAVTHSSEHAASLRRRWLGPVCALFLPSYVAVLEAAAATGTPRPSPREGRLQLTSLGHVTPNKHAERVVRMLAEDPELASRVHYTIVGPYEEDSAYVAELRAAVESSPQLNVELVGWIDEQELDRLMAATDVFVNLRDPVMESASASLAREIAFGRAVLCFDAGCFAEMPEQTVARVPAGDFAAAAAELRRLVEDPDRRRRLGAAACRLASERTELAYASALLAFLERSRAESPALALLDRIGAELGAMEADPRLAVYDTIASDFGRALEF